MEYVIVLLDKTRIPITAEEAGRLEKSANEGLAVFKLVRTGEFISLRPFPNIISSERFEKKEKSKTGVLLSHGQYLPTVEELGFVETEESERKRLAYEGMRTKFLEGKTIPRLTEAEQVAASKEVRERNNS